MTRADQHDRPTADRTPLLARVRDGLSGLDAVVGVLLAVMLLPLVVGPVILVLDFATAGQYGAACLIGITFASLAALAVRAVRRGEFGPTLFGAVIVFVAILVIVSKRLPQ